MTEPTTNAESRTDYINLIAARLGVDPGALDTDELESVSLAELKAFAAAINRANGWNRDEGEGVPPGRVGRVRDKDISNEPGASATALNDDDAGTDSDLDAEPPLPASTVRQYVSRHLSKTGRDAGLNSDGGFGASLDDIDRGD